MRVSVLCILRLLGNEICLAFSADRCDGRWCEEQSNGRYGHEPGIFEIAQRVHHLAAAGMFTLFIEYVVGFSLDPYSITLLLCGLFFLRLVLVLLVFVLFYLD